MIQSDNFSAWIEIEGVLTQEYNVEVTEDEDGPLVTCWIASEEGKTFGAHFKDASCSAPRCWRLRVDGVGMKGRILEPERKGHPSEIACAIKDTPTSDTEKRPFVFSKITTTDDDAYMHRSIDSKFGEITLSVWTTRRVKYRKARSGTSARYAAPLLGGLIHEKSKKIGGHCISFGPVEQTRSKGTKLKTHYWEVVKCLASFSFKYRPLALLQANGIAPLPPPAEPTLGSSECSPEPRAHSIESPVDTGEVTLLRQQLLLIQKRLDEIDKPRGVKREPDAAERKLNKGRKRVKTEGQAPTFVSGEVIDLTSD